MKDSTDNRALPQGDRATTPDGAEPVVSGKAGIPSARMMKFSVPFDAGQVTIELPSNLSLGEAVELEEYICVIFSGVKRRAQAIEARRAETGTGSVHESAVHAPISPSEDQTNEPG